MALNLQGKTILVTGASSGLGLALSRLLAEENVNLALLARRDDVLRRTAAELQHSGSAVLPIKCDVSKREEIQAAYREVRSRFGGVDIAILNAGVSGRGGMNLFDVGAARTMFDVNVFGVVDFLGELLPDFKKRGSGTIVGVSSLSDSRAVPRNGFYCASKSAVSLILDALRIELKPRGIKVVTVKPGFVKTPMTDGNDFKMPFIVSAEKAAAVIVKGLKKEKTYIRFPFLMRVSAWVLKLMPNFLYEIFAARVKSGAENKK